MNKHNVVGHLIHVFETEHKVKNASKILNKYVDQTEKMNQN